MAQFGWAYVNCSSSGGGGAGHAGPVQSIQFLTSSTDTSGSSNFLYLTSSNTVYLSGTLQVVGTITASSFVVDQTDIISGSTIFGNTDDDTHQMTGSLFVGPSASAPVFQVDVYSSQSVTTGFRVAYNYLTSSGFTSSNEDYIIGFGGTGDLEFRVHSASVAGAGAILMIKDEAASRTGTLTISASSGENIDNEGFYELSGSNPAIGLYSNGSNWFVI
jgi:hypothetical protein